MSYFTYYTNIPAENNKPSLDQPSMQTNTNSIDGIIDIDHVGFQQALGGYHTVVHLTNQGTSPTGIPTPVSAIGELFTLQSPALGTFPQDQTMWWQSGTGNPVQMTMNFTPVLNNNSGYTFLPGGMILQYGFQAFSNTGSGSTVTYTFPFPTNIFGVLININDATAGSSDNIQVNGPNNRTSFTAKTNASGPRNCFWVALGK